MARKYYIWKDPACGGRNVEWIEISGQEFLQVCQEESLKRRFVRLNPVDTDDDCYVMEATPEAYFSWLKEKNAHHNCHRRSKSKKVQAEVDLAEKQLADDPDATATRQKWDVGIRKKYSLDAPIKGGDIATLLETIADDSVNVEEEAIHQALLAQLEVNLKRLPKDEHSLVVAYYWHKLTTTELGNLFGVSHVTILRRLDKALEHLRSFF